MSRRGWVVTSAVVCEIRGRTVVAMLDNGHRVFARIRLRDAAFPPAIGLGDRVRVEIPLADPTHGIVMTDERQF